MAEVDTQTGERRQRKSVAFAQGETLIDGNGDVTKVNGDDKEEKNTAESHSNTNGDKPVDEVADMVDDLSLAKKKKKSKKPKEGDKEKADGDEAPVADDDLDLAALKKKKKKKTAKTDDTQDFDAKLKASGADNEVAIEATNEAAEDIAPKDAGDMKEGTGVWAHDNNQNLGYNLLLSRFFQMLNVHSPDSSISDAKRVKIPPPQCLREGNKKTIFANLAEISARMNRSSEHVTQFLFAELGTTGSTTGENRLVIKGKFLQKQIENVLRRYIVEYVTCKTCRSPDTDLVRASFSLNATVARVEDPYNPSIAVSPPKSANDVANKVKRQDSGFFALFDDTFLYEIPLIFAFPRGIRILEKWTPPDAGHGQHQYPPPPPPPSEQPNTHYYPPPPSQNPTSPGFPPPPPSSQPQEAYQPEQPSHEYSKNSFSNPPPPGGFAGGGGSLNSHPTYPAEKTGYGEEALQQQLKNVNLAQQQVIPSDDGNRDMPDGAPDAGHFVGASATVDDVGTFNGGSFRISHRDSNSIVTIQLAFGCPLTARPGVMIAMSPTISLKGGVKFSMKKFLIGGEISSSTFTGPGELILGPHALGDITLLRLEGSEKTPWSVGKDTFLACTQAIHKDYKSQGVGKAMFSGEGLFVYKMSGSGLVWISSFGAIIRKDLQKDEKYIVDNGHLVAWNCNYVIERAASGGIISGMSSGEGLICKFTGPGTVFIQTRSPQAMADWVTANASTTKQ
ncbi:MAG: hypothetical protein M1831_004047 [Alyxoria varia]|nr:MAG: hypothetical protein M1831_004047 [Alyxoria varia]